MNDNPFATGAPFLNSYRTESTGFIQGDAQDDPVVKMSLAAGVVASSVTVPLWPGMGIAEHIPTSAANLTGPLVTEATATDLTGFTVVNQAHHGVISSEENVPQYPAGAGVHFYRTGSGARIPLPVSSAVAALANGTTVNNATAFIWDATNRCVDVVPAPEKEGDVVPSGVVMRLLAVSPAGNMVAKRDATTGNVTWTDSPVGLFLI